MLQVTVHENQLKSSNNEVLALARAAALQLGCEVIPLQEGKIPAFVAPGKQYSFPSNMLHRPGVHPATRYAWQNATGIGILQGDSDLFFLDLDDLTLRPKVEAIIPNLDEAYRVRTGSGGEHIYLRAKLPKLPDGELNNGYSLRIGGHEAASLRAGNRYVVGAGSEYYKDKKPTGKRYEAINQADPLPITAGQLEALIAFFEAKPTPSPKPKVLPKAEALPDEYRRAQAALAALSPDRCEGYHTWIMTGQALKVGLGDSGLVLWDSWSQGSTKYHQGECDRKWKGFKRSGITLATLYKWADEDRPGWRKDYAQAARVTISRPLHALEIAPSLPEAQAEVLPQTSPQKALTNRRKRLALLCDDGRELMIFEAVQSAGLANNFTVQDVINMGFERSTIYRVLRHQPWIVAKSDEDSDPLPIQVFSSDFATRHTQRYKLGAWDKIEADLKARLPSELIPRFFRASKPSDLIPSRLIDRLLSELPEGDLDQTRAALEAACGLQDRQREASSWKAYRRILQDVLRTDDDQITSKLPFGPKNLPDYRRAFASALYDSSDQFRNMSHSTWALWLGCSKSQARSLLEGAGLEGKQSEALSIDVSSDPDPLRAAFEASRGKGKFIGFQAGKYGENVIPVDDPHVRSRLSAAARRGDPIKAKIVPPSRWDRVSEAAPRPKPAPKTSAPVTAPAVNVSKPTPSPKPKVKDNLTKRAAYWRNVMLCAASKLDEGGEGYSPAQFVTLEDAKDLLILSYTEYKARRAKLLSMPALDLRILRSLIRRAVPRLQNSPAEALGLTEVEARAAWASLSRDEQESVMRIVS